MVNPIKNQTLTPLKPPPKKKAENELDRRIKKISKNSYSKATLSQTPKSAIKVSSKISAEKVYLEAEKAAHMARQRAIETKKAALQAQKSAFLAQRAHMAQQAAAAKQARAAERASKAALRAAKKAASLRKNAKISAYLARPEDKKLKNKLSFPPFKKKKNTSF